MQRAFLYPAHILTNTAKMVSEWLADAANMGKQTEIADLLRKHGGKTYEELKAEGN